jgi:hypothetical protein
MRIALALSLACTVLNSCTAARPSAPTAAPLEIAANPAILYDKTVPIESLSLRGVKLGDPRSSIAPSRIDHESKGGWIVCRDRSRYRLDDKGNVVTLGVWDSRILDRLNIDSPDDVTVRFGPPQSTDQAAPLQISRYANGHISVLWNTAENQLSAVNVSK